MKWVLLLTSSFLIILGYSTIDGLGYASQSQIACLPQGDATPHCGFQNPEDIVRIPHSDFLIVSEIGAFMSEEAGNLVLFDMKEKRQLPLDISWQLTGDSWGDPNCEPLDTNAFSPHGIDLITREDKLSLLVVNHGKREAVEFFQLEKTTVEKKSDQTWQLKWKGCAIPPGDPFINDVSGLKDNGFVVTHMWDKQTPYWLLVAKYLFGIDTGWVWRWHPERGFSVLNSTIGAAPNGIVVNNKEDIAYVNLYADDKTIKIDIKLDSKLGELSVQQPDNITLDQSGQLWIASHLHNPITENCNHITSGPCMSPFEIVQVDPIRLNIKYRFSNDNMPMGYATVALKTGSKLYLGSAKGDRILEIDSHRLEQN